MKPSTECECDQTGLMSIIIGNAKSYITLHPPPPSPHIHVEVQSTYPYPSPTYTPPPTSTLEYRALILTPPLPTPLQGTAGVNYIAPTQTALSYWISQGANVFRLPFAWERLQLTKGGFSLDGPAMQTIDDIVTFLTARNVSVILDPHNNECGT